ncbi:uncharacterized protein LOC122557394 isoform X2 [Chiloscyllium plagiosum]|uniref:uncharacterized protein LOC122557394 isoform X2 n=1 Tax=Chiloscyllium plagiosum TaxID=36176 RepID=UPI001CB82B5A|nr:uncharacterized protein LOC122557394 isoform X2 [Chiloscyllium plagiosum]
MKSSLAAPKCRTSVCISTRPSVSIRTPSNPVAPPAAKTNSEATSQRRCSLLTRKGPAQGCSKKPQPELGKQTVATNNLKPLEKRMLRQPSASIVKSGQFSTGSSSLNSTRKLDTKFKVDTRPKENSLNATYCLPSSDSKYKGQIPLKTKDVDVIVQQTLLDINVSKSTSEQEQIQLTCCSLSIMESSNLSHLFTSAIAEECIRIATKLNDKSELCHLHIVDAINPASVTNVSMINNELIPLNCSIASPAKLPQDGTTSELQEENSINCQQILSEMETEDPPVKTNDFTEAGALPVFPSENLIQLNETMLQSDLNDWEVGVLKHVVSSSYMQNKLPIVFNCMLSSSKVELIQLNETIPVTDHVNVALNLSKHENHIRNDQKVTNSFNCTVQLNGTTIVDNFRNRTFNFLYEDDEGCDLNVTSSFHCKMPPSTNVMVPFHCTVTVDDWKNAMFAAKYEDSFETASKAYTLSGCKLLQSTNDKEQLRRIVTVFDCNATFDASKHDNSLENANKITNLPHCQVPLSPGGSNEVRLTSENFKLGRQCVMDYGSMLDQVETGGNSGNSNLILDLGKADSSIGIEKRSVEANGGGDCDFSCSVGLRKGVYGLERSLHLRNSSQHGEQITCEQTDVIHDIVSSEWAPNYISTPYIKRRRSFLEYQQLDQSNLVSSAILQDDMHVGAEESLDEHRSSGTVAIETSSGKNSNVPRSGQQLRQAKIRTENSLKCVDLPGARRKSVSQVRKSGMQKDIIPPVQICKVGCSVVDRGRKPSTQSVGVSKTCLPKPHQVSKKLSSGIGSGQTAGNNKLSSCHIGVNANMTPKAKSNQPLAKSISKIPGLNKRSSLNLSKFIVQETKANFKQASASSRGDITAKYPRCEMKPRLGNCKQQMGMKIKTTGLETTCRSKQELEVAKLRRKNKELEEKITMLEQENAALRQGKENLVPVPEEGSNI